MSASDPSNGSPSGTGSEAADDGFEPVHVDDATPDDAELIETAELVDATSLVSAPPTPPPPRPMPSVSESSSVSPQDREFIQRVFHQVKDVDFRAPPPPPPRKDLAGPDKKIASLRQTVHELERDIARIGFIWGTLQQQFEQADHLLQAKEGERDAAISRYNQLRELSAQTAARDRAELDALKKHVAELEAQRATLEREQAAAAAQASAALQRSEQEKSSLMADFRAKMEAAQHAFGQLREQSTRGMTELQTERERLEGALADSGRSVAALRTELAQLHTQHEAGLEDLRGSLKARDELVESTRGELRAAVEAQEARKRELDSVRDELTRARDEAAALHSELGTLSGELTRRTESLAAAEAELEKLRAGATTAPPTRS